MKFIMSLVGMAAAMVAIAGLHTASARDGERSRDRVIHQSRSTDGKRPLGGKTVGAGRSVPANGPFYDPSIHQSAGGRDSRGTPKYCPNGNC